MFENVYLMDSKRYSKWTVPKFYMLPIFYIYIVVFILAAVGFYVFTKISPNNRFMTLSVVLMFISVYRGIPHKWMVSNKQYRLMKQKYFNNMPWTCKVVVNSHSIELYINDKSNNTVFWNDIKKFVEAKSYFTLGTGNGREGVQLDKESFTIGDAESFKEYMKKEHPDIACEWEVPAFDK